MKYLLLIAAILLTTTNSADAQSRLVLYEEFTSETCPPSRPVDSNLWVLLNSGSNPDNVQYITFVTPYPGPGALFNSDKPDYNARTSYYSVPFVSYGRLDGELHDTSTTQRGIPYHMTQPKLDSEIAKPSAFNIFPTCEFSSTGELLNIKAHITCVEDFAPESASMKLYIALVRTMDYSTAPGTNGMKHFENMVRKMYPGPAGTSISNSWTTGQTADVNVTDSFRTETADSLLHPHTSSPGYIVMWIQNDHDKVVAQAAKVIPTYPAPPTENERIAMSNPSISIYPNPATSNINLSFAITHPEDICVSIKDMTGKTVYQLNEKKQRGAYDRSIPVRDLPNGIYTVTLQTSAGLQKAQFVIAK